MPDFCRPRRGARHTLDSALRSLRRLGVGEERVVVESAGPGWSAGTVVRQDPAPGVPLGGQTRVVLGVAGVGALESLPYALRDVDESAFGVDPLVGVFDNPIYKLQHHLRGGGEFFALRAGDPITARRWIEQVFQIDPSPWAEERWPALARLLPALHRVAGREAALHIGLRTLFGLPTAGIALTRAVVELPADERLALGVRGARLGVDSVLGQGLADLAQLEVTIGPVSLDAYWTHDAPAMRAERRALYALVVPAPLAASVEERWVVGDPHAGMRLADAFGAAAVAPAAEALTAEAFTAGAFTAGAFTVEAPTHASWAAPDASVGVAALGLTARLASAGGTGRGAASHSAHALPSNGLGGAPHSGSN